MRSIFASACPRDGGLRSFAAIGIAMFKVNPASSEVTLKCEIRISNCAQRRGSSFREKLRGQRPQLRADFRLGSPHRLKQTIVIVDSSL